MGVVTTITGCYSEGPQAAGFTPLSNEAAAALVTPMGESVAANADENLYTPTEAQWNTWRSLYLAGHTITARMSSLRTHVDGGLTAALSTRFGRYPTTGELLRGTAHKWGFDEDLMFAQAFHESSWDMDAVGDAGHSFGLMQEKDTAMPGSFPISRDSTSGHLDIYGFSMRMIFEGIHPDYSCNHGGSIASAFNTWFSGDCSAQTYYNTVYATMQDRTWEDL